MPEHLIRLRGAWQCHSLNDPDAPPRRLDLPTSWLDFPSGRLRLTRRFQGPAIDLDWERIVLRLADVPGLLSVRLNDREITPVARSFGSEVVDLAIKVAPRASHLLALEVDLGGAGVERWGSIALVVLSEPQPPES
ncbi:hypothetical protein BH23PLA1_BH23PLA1_25890 [soil metagenome]